MTKIVIMIKDGKVSWMGQAGDPLPEDLWERINIAIANAMEKGGDNERD